MRKKYPAAFKAKVALEAIKELKTIGEIASENSVPPTMVRNSNSKFENLEMHDENENA